MKKIMIMTMIIGMSIIGTQASSANTTAKNAGKKPHMEMIHHGNHHHNMGLTKAIPGCNCLACHNIRVKEMHMRAIKHQPKPKPVTIIKTHNHSNKAQNNGHRK